MRRNSEKSLLPPNRELNCLLDPITLASEGHLTNASSSFCLSGMSDKESRRADHRLLEKDRFLLLEKLGH